MFYYTYSTSNNAQNAPHTVISKEIPPRTYCGRGTVLTPSGLLWQQVFDGGTKLVPLFDTLATDPDKQAQIVDPAMHGLTFNGSYWEK